jgi:hypothetical protein
MRALTVRPGVADSARVEEIAEPPEPDGPVLVETLAVGICGTDAEIVRAEYRQAPPGEDRLVLGVPAMERLHRLLRGAPPPLVPDAGHFALESGDVIARTALRAFGHRGN